MCFISYSYEISATLTNLHLLLYFYDLTESGYEKMAKLVFSRIALPMVPSIPNGVSLSLPFDKKLRLGKSNS